MVCYSIDGARPQEVFAGLLERCLLECELMSDQAIKEWVGQALETVSEVSWEKKSWLTRNVSKIGSAINNLEGKRLRRYLADLYLAGMGLGNLFGFGLAKCEKSESGGSRKIFDIGINPETQSIYNLE